MKNGHLMLKRSVKLDRYTSKRAPSSRLLLEIDRDLEFDCINGFSHHDHFQLIAA